MSVSIALMKASGNMPSDKHNLLTEGARITIQSLTKESRLHDLVGYLVDTNFSEIGEANMSCLAQETPFHDYQEKLL